MSRESRRGPAGELDARSRNRLRALASRAVAGAAMVTLACAWAALALADPVEPVPSGAYCRLKSPGPQMHFTAGLPLRLLADGHDPDGWARAPCGRTVAREVRFFVDGAMLGVASESCDAINHYEVRLTGGLPAGPHTLTVQSLNERDRVVDGLVAVAIVVDPMPVRARIIRLDSDVVLRGDEDLDWQDAVVLGAGHRVRAEAGWTGDVLIRDAFVTGLGDYDVAGIQVRSSAQILIEDSVFEATGGMSFAVGGSGTVRIVGNELRANNLVTYVASDPDRSPVLEVDAGTSGTKVFAGNNVGGGIVVLRGEGWLVGGDTDEASNIFIGPRAVLTLERAPSAVIRGNYLHHDYWGGWSQGFNLRFDGTSDGALAEHNVIRDSSWPVQSFGGEFRYNLVINSGHDWFRSAQSASRFHHNVIVHSTAPDGHFQGGFYFYGSESGIVIEHNTFDGGGAIGRYDGPVAHVNGTAFVESFRFNLVANFSTVSAAEGGAFLSTTGTALPRAGVADYNCFANPLAISTPHYLAGITRDLAGAHDITGTCAVNAGNEIPYSRAEGDIWNRRYRVSQVLAHYRERFTPSAGSELIDAAESTGADIGAIESATGAPRPEDRFGRFGSPRTDFDAPSIEITAPAGGATLRGPVTISAAATDDVGVASVQIFANDRLLADRSAPPYEVVLDSCTLVDGEVAFSARAWDAAGNEATSSRVRTSVMNGGACEARSDAAVADMDGGLASDGGRADGAARSDGSMGPPPIGDGCACRATRSGLGWRGVLALLLVVWAWRRRRGRAVSRVTNRGIESP